MFNSDISSMLGAYQAESSGTAWILQVARHLRRKKMVILASTLVAGALFCTYAKLADPKYLAIAEVVVDGNQASPFKQIQVAVGSGEVELAAVDDEVLIIGSDTVLRQVVRKLHLVDDAEFQTFGHTVLRDLGGPVLQLLAKLSPSPDVSGMSPTSLAESRAVETLYRLTEIKRQATSKVIDIGVRTPVAARSAQLANALADAYLQSQLDAKMEIALGSSAWLSGGIAKVRNDALTADQAAQEFKDSHRLVDTLDRGPIGNQKLLDFNTQLIAAHGRTEDAKARASQIDDILAHGIGELAVADSLTNPVIVKIRTDYFNTAQRIKELRSRYGKSHVAVLQAEQDLENIKNSGTEELQTIAQSYHNDALVAAQSEAAMQREYERLVTESGEQSKVRVTLRDLNSSAETYRALYVTYLQRYNQAIQDQSFPVSQSRVFSRAVAPLRTSTNVPLLFGLSLAFGAVAGSGGVLTFAVFDRRLREPTQVERVTGLECVAALEDFGAARKGVTSHKTDVAKSGVRLLDSRSDRRSEVALYALVARLVRGRPADGGGLAVGLVSGVPGEGTTTVTYNLARLLAKSGYRTLVVDLDLQDRDLSKAVAPAYLGGIGRAIGESESLANNTLRDALPGLSILPCAAVSGGVEPSAVLGGLQTAAFLGLRKAYDFVLYDLPAVSTGAEFALSESFVDSFVFVVRAGMTDQDVVCENIRLANLPAERVIGILLNKVERA